MVVSRRLQHWNGIGGDHIDDIAQDVLLSVHNKRNTYIPGLPVEAWLTGIVRYKTIDWLRSNANSRKHVSLEDIEHLSFEDDLAKTANPTAHLELESMVGELSGKQKSAVLLTKIEGLSISETAKRLEMSETSVKVTVHRALSKLKNLEAEAMTTKPIGNTLVDQLVRDHTRTSGLRRPAVLLFLWVLFSLLYVPLMTSFVLKSSIGKLYDFDTVTGATFCLLTGLSFISGCLAFAGSIPGLKTKLWVQGIPLVLLAIWILLILRKYESPASGFSVPGVNEAVCGGMILALALLPAVVLTLALRKLAPLDEARAGWLVLISGLSLGGICLQTFCPHVEWDHHLYGHWGVIVLFSSLGLYFGKRFLKW
ncbi:MAG: NrsF family protein [Bdellovibrionales bacterium]|nr:NrsF family protein [Bdellovibrionales bacterium]